MTEFQQQVINLINEQKTISEIAKILNRNMSSVSSVVKRFNLNPKKARENTIIDDFFDEINTDEKAYLLGFFIADGYISNQSGRKNKRFGINQSIDDLEVVEAFKIHLNIPTKIQYVNNQNGVKSRKIQCRVRWTSSHMETTMRDKYHIVSNKTLDTDFSFPIELIPEIYQGAFVRGFIDGDGYMGNNGQENNFSVSIVGTSLNFITTIGDIVSKNTGMSYKVYKSQGKTCSYYSLRWSCYKDKLNKIIKLRNFLYSNASIFLSRKKEKIDYYIEYRANVLNNTNTQCNAQEMNLEIEYNSPTSAQPLTDNAEGENIC